MAFRNRRRVRSCRRRHARRVVFPRNCSEASGCWVNLENLSAASPDCGRGAAAVSRKDFHSRYPFARASSLGYVTGGKKRAAG
jgi:hypothetical protein